MYRRETDRQTDRCTERDMTFVVTVMRTSETDMFMKKNSHMVPLPETSVNN